ncbi:MAG: hypothetical protein AAF206_22385, partial [Bacteroidota bacterium]
MSLSSVDVYQIIAALPSTLRPQLARFLEYDIPDLKANQLGQAMLSHFDEAEWLKKERHWRVLYPDRPFQDKRFRRICTELKRSVERFLIMQNLEDHAELHDWLLLESYSELHLPKAFDRHLKKVNKSLRTAPIQDIEHAYRRYTRDEQVLTDLSQRSSRDHMPQAAVDLDESFQLYWMHRKLRNLLILQYYYPEHPNCGDTPANQFLINAIQDLSEELPDKALLLLIWDILLLLRNERDDTEEIGHRFKSMASHFSPSEGINFALTIYTKLQNLYFQYGTPDSLRRRMNWYEWMYSDDFPFPHPPISLATIKNLIIMYEWSDQIDKIMPCIERFQDQLPEEQHKADIRLFGKVIIHNAKKEYDEVIRSLPSSLHSKRMQLELEMIIIEARYDRNQDDDRELALRKLHNLIRSTKRADIPDAIRRYYLSKLEIYTQF